MKVQVFRYLEAYQIMPFYLIWNKVLIVIYLASLGANLFFLTLIFYDSKILESLQFNYSETSLIEILFSSSKPIDFEHMLS